MVRWKTIPSTMGKYEVSSTGNVRLAATPVEQVRTSKQATPYVTLVVNNRRRHVPVHVLIAETFTRQETGGASKATARKVTDDQVRQIRQRRADGERPTAIAREYGIHVSQVSRITARKAYKWVE